MHNTTVRAPQFFALLYLSMLSSIFMYISSPKTVVSDTDAVLRPLIFLLMSIVTAIPIYFVCKNGGFLSRNTDGKKTILYKIIALIYAIVYFIDAVMTTARFDLFASSELFPGTEMTAFIIGLIIVCVYLASLGIGALGRASTIFTVVVISATMFAAFTLTKEIDILNFTPLFEKGIGKFFEDGFMFGIRASEIGAIVLFSSQITGNIKKHYIIWSVFSTLTFSLIIFYIVGTLGVFADTKLFPTYSAISLAEFGLFERLDALETAIWILCVVSKLTFYIIAVKKCVCYVFSSVSDRIVGVTTGIVISSILIFISLNILNFDFLSFPLLVIGVYIVPVVILPSVLLLVNFIKRRKGIEKNI